MNRRSFLATGMLLSAGSAFAKPKSYAFRCGISSITWAGKDLQAIQDIGELGYKGIQLRANTVKDFGQDPALLKAALDKAGLSLVMFSSGNVEVSSERRQASIEQHVKHAQFVKALGGNAIQLTNSLRKNNQAPSAEELKNLAAVMNEIGARTQDLGVQSTYHNHMNQWGETPEEVDVLAQNMDPKKVRLLLDVAHYFRGGGDPAKAVLDYKSILHSLHLKDVEWPVKGKEDQPSSYKFVELGQGKVDFFAIFNNLARIKFKGWAIVELDGVPSPDKTAKGCALTSKNYLVDRLGHPFV